jgi:hypothetical protein
VASDCLLDCVPPNLPPSCRDDLRICPVGRRNVPGRHPSRPDCRSRVLGLLRPAGGQLGDYLRRSDTPTYRTGPGAHRAVST